MCPPPGQQAALGGGCTQSLDVWAGCLCLSSFLSRVQLEGCSDMRTGKGRAVFVHGEDCPALSWLMASPSRAPVGPALSWEMGPGCHLARAPTWSYSCPSPSHCPWERSHSSPPTPAPLLLPLCLFLCCTSVWELSFHGSQVCASMQLGSCEPQVFNLLPPSPSHTVDWWTS